VGLVEPATVGFIDNAEGEIDDTIVGLDVGDHIGLDVGVDVGDDVGLDVRLDVDDNVEDVFDF